MAQAQYPSYCGAYFSGLVANKSLLSFVKKYQVLSCHLNVNDSLPLSALPVLKYATVSYPFMAISLSNKFPIAISPNPVNINNTNKIIFTIQLLSVRLPLL